MNVAALLVAVALVVAAPRLAQADDAGTEADADTSLPVECDGALCDTTYGAECSVGIIGDARPQAASVLAGVLLLVAARRRRRLMWGAAAVMFAIVPREAHADPPGPVDVTVHDEPPPRRYVSVAWNPVPLLMLGKVSFDVVITPTDHHALVLSPFYVSTATVPIFIDDSNGGPTQQLPQQTFSGWGGEIGYRYYFGHAGPRGFFLGASFIIGAFNASAQNGTSTSYWDFGGAIDAGYQMLVADRVVLAAGLGLQYTATDKSIPSQEWPANIYANDRLNPRLLLSIGWAF
jgi:Protein of unknown function (DUF3575)